jgi:hypothetical protein
MSAASKSLVRYIAMSFLMATADVAFADSVIVVSVGGKSFTAKVEDSETGRAFVAKLPLTLSMTELNGNEKYCYGVSLPTASRYYSTIEAGDLMLYGSNCVVLFYGAAGGYSYTRIGRLTSTAGLASALGNGSASVTFDKARLEAIIKMDGDIPSVAAVTNLPEGTSITTLAAKSLSAAESEWKDYDSLDAEEKSKFRFFKLKADVK